MKKHLISLFILTQSTIFWTNISFCDLETFDSLTAKSCTFHENTPFPTQNNRISSIAGQNITIQKHIAEQANNVRPIIHTKTIALFDDYLTHKKRHGSKNVKKLYKNMNMDAFINRLLTNRPLMFMTCADDYLLRNNVVGSGDFESIGLDSETSPLLLKNYLSYDEMQLSALIGVSAPTFFINDGNRNNKAQSAHDNTYQKEGIYVGLVGARFEKPCLMEWQHMIITPSQNTAKNGYGPHTCNNPKAKFLKIWAKFYGEDHFPTFEQVKNDNTDRYINLDDKETFLDTQLYKKRLKMVIEPFLIEANERGKAQNKKVYCHAVGLGLGVWQIDPIQTRLMIEVYEETLKDNILTWISDINFSWFDPTYKENIVALPKGKNSHIKIHCSHRNPAEKLIGENENKLLVAMYAWDSNAYPGNEYWQGYLNASGDPAAACCSTIAELQNPLINSNVSSEKIKLFGPA